MPCNGCKKDFIKQHFNQKCCSDACKIIARKATVKRYKKTEKGRAAVKRWQSSERFKENEKKLKSKPHARALAVKISLKYLKSNIAAQEKKIIRDREFARTERGKVINRISAKKYRKTDKGKIQKKNSKHIRRKREGSVKITALEWKEKLMKFGNKCAHCGAHEKIEMDHIIPLARGGTHCIENVQPLCRSCNARKGAKIQWAA